MSPSDVSRSSDPMTPSQAALRGRDRRSVAVSVLQTARQFLSDVGPEEAIDRVETQKAESHLCGSEPIKTMTSWRLILQLPAHAQPGGKNQRLYRAPLIRLVQI